MAPGKSKGRGQSHTTGQPQGTKRQVKKECVSVNQEMQHRKVCMGSLKGGCSMAVGFALIFPRKLQEELAVAQGMLLEKKAVIGRLSRELSETRARMSDMRGG